MSIKTLTIPDAVTTRYPLLATRYFQRVFSPRKNSTLALIDELLAEQSRLQTPVARFAATHFEGRPSTLGAQLIPLSLPKPGEQYAFEVDLDSCTGCKACVSACHALNGLDDTEAWRDVGLVSGGTRSAPYQQTVTTACHHCADPACLNGCPVLAYEKDPITGIVRHLDDQCIGCQYCVLKCPYEVPKYNERLGIVRKCDMCHQRLGAGEAPACVQACPTQAIKIVTVSVTVSGTPSPRADVSRFLPVAPDPAYTQPTTRYLSRREAPPDTLAADNATLRPQPAHWPLALMLTLLPLAIGAQLAALSVAQLQPGHAAFRELAVGGWIAGLLGLLASITHLGKPLRAWRIFLGWRKSWLSREAMIFGAWFGLSSLSLLVPAALLPAAATGIVGLFCSIMIYADTRRRLWRFQQTAPRFLGSALILGAAAMIALGLGSPIAFGMLAAVTIAKLVCDARIMRPLDAADLDDPLTPELHSARLLQGPLRPLFGLRVVAAVAAAFLLPLLMAAGKLPPATGWTIFTLVLLGELVERHLFFRAVDAPKMPGTAA